MKAMIPLFFLLWLPFFVLSFFLLPVLGPTLMVLFLIVAVVDLSGANNRRAIEKAARRIAEAEAASHPAPVSTVAPVAAAQVPAKPMSPVARALLFGFITALVCIGIWSYLVGMR